MAARRHTRRINPLGVRLQPRHRKDKQAASGAVARGKAEVNAPAAANELAVVNVLAAASVLAVVSVKVAVRELRKSNRRSLPIQRRSNSESNSRHGEFEGRCLKWIRT